MSGKPTLILVPGLLCSARLWAAQIDGLSDLADIAVADMTRDDTMAGMAQRVLDCTDGTFSLAGLSMGGYVAMEVMRRAPERVERLALLDTGARADTEEQTIRRRDLIGLADRGEFKAVSPKLLPLFVHPDRLADKAMVDAISKMADSVGKDAFLRQQQAIMHRPDSRPGLAAIACTTLVVCGREDVLTPPELSEEIAGLVPGADFVLIEGCGHLSTMERPDDVNAALRSWMSR
ncbi:MAG: alpha/beta fold hydrolase [Alphaproteobacteria bacterium]|jgi:pimeloyl-ACP methyl ester carboxylesterase|nr:alpha/beta fold hydrolase [Alphaproteobacteria bacterium]